jgi:tape measure domain-containing protein
MVEKVGIQLDLAGRRELAAGLEEGEQGFQDLEQAAESAGKAGERSGRRFDRTRSILSGVGRGLIFGAKAAGAMAVAGAAVGIKTAAGMETAKIGFTTMLGSAKRANTFLRDLAGFAARTPFEFPELQTAASRLVSAGIETKKIIPMMTTLGDVTAGMGTGSEGITRATNALQQMNAAQRISAEDLNQLRDAGIPVYDLLASALGKTKAEVVALKDEGKLGKGALDAMMGALTTGKGLERFDGLMEKQSKSLAGRWSTLKDTVTMGLAGAVKPALPLVKDLLVVATDLAEKAMPKIQSALKSGTKFVRNFVREWQKGGGGKGGLSTAMASLSAPGIPKSAGAIGDGIQKIGTAISDVDWGKVKEGLGEGVADTISVTGFAIGVLADHLPELAKHLPLIVAGFAAWKVAQAAGNLVQIAAIPLVVAQTASNFALASANRSLAAATGTAAATQRGLNLAMLASPLGIVIGLVILVAGAMYLAYQKSETFRGIIDTLYNGVLKPFGEWLGGVLLGAIKLVAQMLLNLGRWGIMGFRLLLTAAFATFDGILLAAEKGLGWIPGLGDKIKGARSAFNEFGDATIAKLKRVEDRLTETSRKLDDVARDRSATITVTYAGLAAPGGSGPTRGRDDIPGVANGGHVRARHPYIVGERRAELFVPSVSGRIIPRVPDSPADLEEIDPDAFGPRGPREPIVAKIFLDRRQIAEALLDEFDDAGARR